MRREETKRLLYVALTRARDRLYLGIGAERRPSPAGPRQPRRGAAGIAPRAAHAVQTHRMARLVGSRPSVACVWERDVGARGPLKQGSSRVRCAWAKRQARAPDRLRAACRSVPRGGRLRAAALRSRREDARLAGVGGRESERLVGTIGSPPSAAARTATPISRPRASRCRTVGSPGGAVRMRPRLQPENDLADVRAKAGCCAGSCCRGVRGRVAPRGRPTVVLIAA